MVGEVLRDTLLGIEFRLALLQRPFDVLQILRRTVAGAELDGLDFEQHTHVDQRREVVLSDLKRVGDHAFEHLHLLLGDHRAALGEGLDDAVKFEFLKRRTHMGAADAQHVGQPPLGREAFARLQTSGIKLILDVFQDGFHLFDVRRVVHGLFFCSTKIAKKPIKPNNSGNFVNVPQIPLRKVPASGKSRKAGYGPHGVPERILHFSTRNRVETYIFSRFQPNV